MITREAFHNMMNDIKMCYEFQDKMNNLIGSNPYGYSIEWYPPDCSYSLCCALSEIFNDEADTVSWFCYEIGFGASYETGDNIYNGKEWPLRTIDELYDYLVMIRGDDVSDSTVGK